MNGKHEFDFRRRWLWLTLFSVAMGYLESAVVVYLRLLYYPDGFDFPLRPMGEGVAMTEVLREAATMIMLAGMAFFAGRNSIQRFACFLFCFAIWDIFYYVFLKWLLDWPVSLMTWDVLFLIPATWTGPVLTPLIVSVLMIVLALELVFLDSRMPGFRVSKRGWMLLTAGALVVIMAFSMDHFVYLSEGMKAFSLSQFLTMSVTYVPHSFPWWIFVSGIGIIAAGMMEIARTYFMDRPPV